MSVLNAENLVDKITSSFSELLDPYLGKSLREAKMLSLQFLEDGLLKIEVRFPYPAAGFYPLLKAQMASKLATFGVSNFAIEFSTKIRVQAVQKELKVLKEVRNIIAVASGKGGVGKSTVAVNLALAIQAEGGKAGILDADIYGPSQPMMLGINHRPEMLENKRMRPIMHHGLQSMSMGYLIEAMDAPMVWRGPMVSSALSQFVYDTAWQDLDYLIVDLPPGTGDIQLTLAQKVPLSAIVIVTTPQDVALLDARKALNMFRKMHVPVLGVVENMSLHHCPACGHNEPIFGEGGGQKMAAQYEVPLLGQLPLTRQIRESTDKGLPSVLSHPTGHIAERFRDIARHITAKLSLLPRDYSLTFAELKA